MTNASNALRSASAQDLGHRGIDKAGRDFQDRWEHGIGKISEFTGKVVEALQSSKKAYEETERSIADIFSQADGSTQQGPTDCGWGNAMNGGDGASSQSAIAKGLTGQ